MVFYNSYFPFSSFLAGVKHQQLWMIMHSIPRCDTQQTTSSPLFPWGCGSKPTGLFPWVNLHSYQQNFGVKSQPNRFWPKSEWSLDTSPWHVFWIDINGLQQKKGHHAAPKCCGVLGCGQDWYGAKTLGVDFQPAATAFAEKHVASPKMIPLQQNDPWAVGCVKQGSIQKGLLFIWLGFLFVSVVKMNKLKTILSSCAVYVTLLFLFRPWNHRGFGRNDIGQWRSHLSHLRNFAGDLASTEWLRSTPVDDSIVGGFY